jgi:hypothetical protein
VAISKFYLKNKGLLMTNITPGHSGQPEATANSNNGGSSQNPHHEAVVKVTVRYPSATKPFVDANADRSETVGALKARVLSAFEVHDSVGPDGTTTSYFLYHESMKLENPAVSLGELAQGEDKLSLKLVQFVHQGH